MAISDEMKRCIDVCLDCYKTCLGTATNRCLETGGEHVARPHFRLMMACVEMCRTIAHCMLISSPHHKYTCRECAEICTEWAKDCERLDGMEACVAACRVCAESCNAMAV